MIFDEFIKDQDTLHLRHLVGIFGHSQNILILPLGIFFICIRIIIFILSRVMWIRKNNESNSSVEQFCFVGNFRTGNSTQPYHTAGRRQCLSCEKKRALVVLLLVGPVHWFAFELWLVIGGIDNWNDSFHSIWQQNITYVMIGTPICLFPMIISWSLISSTPVWSLTVPVVHNIYVSDVSSHIES